MTALEASAVAIARRSVDAAGYEVVDVKIDGRRHMRIWIDRDPEGVKVADCIEANRAVRHGLDEEGLDSGAFQVDVMSPGLDRVLTRAKDFTLFLVSQPAVHLSNNSRRRTRVRGRSLKPLHGVADH